MNEFQSLAEQQLLLWFAVSGSAIWIGIPQFLAQLAAAVAIYRCARLLGFGGRESVCAGLLFCTLSVVALESITAQNDIVAASLAVTAAALLLGATSTEVVLAGIASSLGLGTKLTVVMVMPVIFILAIRLGRRAFALFVAGLGCGLVVGGAWSYVLNTMHTGKPLGYGDELRAHAASPSFPGSLTTGTRVLQRFVDLTGFGPSTVRLLGIAAVVALVMVVWSARKRGESPSPTVIGAILLVLIGPLLLPAVMSVGRGIYDHFDPPGSELAIRWPFASPGKAADEDISGFGPLGLAVVLVVVTSLVAAVRSKRDVRRLALASALPLFLVLLALTAKYNPWLSRFLIVPVALTIPLAARLFSSVYVRGAIATLAVVTMASTLVHSQHLPPNGPFGRPWALDQAEAMDVSLLDPTGAVLRRLDRLAPLGTHVGALFDADQPAFLLYSRDLSRKVSYLPRKGAVAAATESSLPIVVVSLAEYRPRRLAFERAGWIAAQPDTRSARSSWVVLLRRK